MSEATEAAKHTRICQLAVADPDGSVSQAEMLDLLELRGHTFAESIFARCGVKKRRLELSPDVLATSLQQRTPRTERRLFDLAVDVVDHLDVDRDDIGTVIIATYYSLGGPTLAHRLVDHYELDPATANSRAASQSSWTASSHDMP